MIRFSINMTGEILAGKLTSFLYGDSVFQLVESSQKWQLGGQEQAYLHLMSNGTFKFRHLYGDRFKRFEEVKHFLLREGATIIEVAAA